MVLTQDSLEFGIEERKKVFWWLELVLCSQSTWYMTVHYASIVADLTALERQFKINCKAFDTSCSSWLQVILGLWGIFLLLFCRESLFLKKQLPRDGSGRLPLLFVDLMNFCTACCSVLTTLQHLVLPAYLPVTARYSNKVLNAQLRVCWHLLNISKIKLYKRRV